MIQGRDKQKKIKPMKQPTKPVRTLLTNSNKHPQQSHIHQSIKQSMPKSKLPASMTSSQPQDKKITTLQNVCTDLLDTGNIQAFIDLFYISHKCLPNVMVQKNYFGEKLHIPDNTGEESQEYNNMCKELGQSLIKAEVRPQFISEQKEAAMNQYNTLAFNYEDSGDCVTACYFYNKVIQIALSSKNKQYELVALLGLGKCYDQQNYKDKAIQLLEGAFDDAAVIENEEQRIQMTKLIGKQLIQIYIKKASQCEKFALEQGLQAYESALKVAKRANQPESEARISHKIGELYYQQEKYGESVSYQENYLELLKKILDEEFEKMNTDTYGEKKDNTQERQNLKMKEMQAHASLAKCYLKLKEIEKAQEHLNDYHRMAKEAKAQNSLADSSYYLAKLFQEKGEKQKAIAYYQSYFQAAKSQKSDKKDRRLVDKARVTYAIAKSNKNMEKYISIFNEEDNLKKLLDWKIKRVLK